MKNIFFDVRKLKKCGKNVIIGKTVRIRYPELVELGDNTIIDDFCYISTALETGRYCHISAGCSLIGGKGCLVKFGDFSTIAPNVVLVAGSDDYRSGIASVSIPAKFRGNLIIGNVTLGRHCIVGSTSTVMPNVILHEGSALGSHSLAKKDLEAWMLYAGIPAREIGERSKDEILSLEKELSKTLKNGK
jgi:acetyltransferase-like isoleucine patch superfamily enzyme